MSGHKCGFPCERCLREILKIEIPESIMSLDEAVLAVVNPTEYRRRKVAKLKEQK